ncbi:MAG: hypothetical protein ACOCTS_00305 [Thermodesulfobacteriota bacterium]
MDLSDLCRRHLPHMESVIAQGIHLEPDLEVSGPFAWINEEEFKQALAGLVLNAGEAIESDAGRVVIRTCLVSAPDCTEADFSARGGLTVLSRRLPSSVVLPGDQCYICETGD